MGSSSTDMGRNRAPSLSRYPSFPLKQGALPPSPVSLWAGTFHRKAWTHCLPRWTRQTFPPDLSVSRHWGHLMWQELLPWHPSFRVPPQPFWLLSYENSCPLLQAFPRIRQSPDAHRLCRERLSRYPQPCCRATLIPVLAPRWRPQPSRPPDSPRQHTQGTGQHLSGPQRLPFSPATRRWQALSHQDQHTFSALCPCPRQGRPQVLRLQQTRRLRQSRCTSWWFCWPRVCGTDAVICALSAHFPSEPLRRRSWGTPLCAPWRNPSHRRSRRALSVRRAG